jgi:hypothetical protein
MTRHGLLFSRAAQGAARELRDTRHWREGPAVEDPAAADGAAALDADDPADAERARLRCKAGVHSQVASWISGLVAGTAGWHLGEARRLRELAGRVNGTEGPAAAPAPGQTISGQTTRQPGGCGQAGGA